MILDCLARKKFKMKFKILSSLPSAARKDDNGLIFFEIWNIRIRTGPEEGRMSTELECPICDADIPLEGNEKPGDLVLCSYCKVTFKLIRARDKWVLSEDFEE